jgi:hypothetical protein
LSESTRCCIDDSRVEVIYFERSLCVSVRTTSSLVFSDDIVSIHVTQSKRTLMSEMLNQINITVVNKWRRKNLLVTYLPLTTLPTLLKIDVGFILFLSLSNMLSEDRGLFIIFRQFEVLHYGCEDCVLPLPHQA